MNTAASRRELSDLGRARDMRGVIDSVERLDGGIVELRISAPHLAVNARPGEFAQLRPAGDGFQPLLRRPMSVSWTEGDFATFVLEPIGEGTRKLCAMHPGDELEVLGPLGNGFDVHDVQRALIVSGGLGCAPFPLLIRELHRAGCRDITVLNGATTAVRLYPAHRFRGEQYGVAVHEATDDGSRGQRGYVTDLVAKYCDANTTVFACGRNPMMATLATLLNEIPHAGTQFSLEAAMGCGFGTCLGCVIPVARDDGGEGHWELCCRSGPVFQASAIDWEQLMNELHV